MAFQLIRRRLDKSLNWFDFLDQRKVVKMNAAKYLAPALLLAALSGCATYPIAKDLRQHAQMITISQVKADPAGTRGAIVIWGGRIINVSNDTNGGALYIVCLPLRPNERPLAHGPSPGRFIATSTEFLDPEMFPLHSLITVAGQLDGVWTEQLGNVPYTYPVLQIEQTYLWPTEAQEYAPYYGYYGPDWWWDWWPDWWWGGGFYPFYGGYGGYYGGGFHHGFHGGFRGGFRGGGGGGFRGGGGGGGHGGGGGGGHGGGGGAGR
jgi:outer membrane lipoprotein